MQALTVVLLPTSFFFIFLYYTDIGSLAFFLASYLVRGNPTSPVDCCELGWSGVG